MNTKNAAYQILPAAIAREELRLRASGEAEKLSRSVSRRTSCGEAYPEYREEVVTDYDTVDELLFCQQCRAALERCLANKTAALRYRRRDGAVQTVRFCRLPQGRVKIWGLS